RGYYSVKLRDREEYMALSGSWNTYFVADSASDAAKYAIEEVQKGIVRLRCKANQKYLGTDNSTAGSSVYSDKDGQDERHYWLISEEIREFPVDTDSLYYLINPADTFCKSFEGWGVSLCWWANMCGRWEDDKIDEIIDWLVSPEGLNYRIFRYNIGGGDDPLNRNCDPHHMALGKGLRAEMEGFKDSADAPYNWNRDAAQRKIMLKIREKRPDAVFEAFSNSPPYYMTYSGCSAGNEPASLDNLNPDYYEAFAEYLVDVCHFYKDSFDLEFKTLEPFNEPVTDYWGRNGGQEGCHFSTASQIAFLRVLAPKLEASGLKTVISASDESYTDQSVRDYLAYRDEQVLSLTGQWNTHSYSANNRSRAALRELASTEDITLWMSEVGAGGSGLAGNLSLAQKLMDDIRYIRPEAWIDWQYIEENNDQWCTVRGNFQDQSYWKVKNFYVRQHFTQFIQSGWRFLNVPNDRMLAALSPEGDSLIVVALNANTLRPAYHSIDLSLFDEIYRGITMSRTSQSENNRTVNDFVWRDSCLQFVLPPQSITTLMIPLAFDLETNTELQSGRPYLLASRCSGLMLQTEGDEVLINNYRPADSSQLWVLQKVGEAYSISNLQGLRLSDEGSYYLKTSPVFDQNNQLFSLDQFNDGFYKIASLSTGNALDLQGANYTAGTRVGLYGYDEGGADKVVTRQWMILQPPRRPSDFNTSLLPREPEPTMEFRLSVAPGTVQLFCPSFGLDRKIYRLQLFNLSGVMVRESTIDSAITHLSLPAGFYLLSIDAEAGERIFVQKIIVH
ncbi:MAG: glycoside hydrolase, partial [Bacteroidales bacterium]|nr:glycoside hydrolase [Bacteroidales bacterium]